jgi:FAD/FMN-containing dehydrogenase
VNWRNWARTVSATAARVVRPPDPEALAREIRGSSAPLRVMGSGHSWSPLGLADPDHTAIELVEPAFLGLQSEVSPAGEVWVGAATPVLRLHALLAAHGRSLANSGSISAQTAAGLTATGTHGSGRMLPCLSAAVTGVRVVTTTGDIREYTVEEHPRELGFLQLSLGCLAVITALRLETVPLFYVAECQSAVPLDQGPEVLPGLVAAEATSGLRHRFSWFPHGRRARIQAFASVAPPAVLPDPFDRAPFRTRLEGRLLGEALFGALLAVCGRIPAAAPPVFRFADRIHFRNDTRVGRLWERVNEHGIPRHRETEWAVPLDSAAEAWRAMRCGIAKRGLPADFLQELRPARRDGIPLSAARERDVCWVSLYQTSEHRWEESLAFADEVLGGLGGRPHWGKEFDPRGIADRVGPELAAFEGFRRSIDPPGRLLGPWHRRCGLG